MENILNEFVDILKKRPECIAIAVFGSYARGQQRPNSDIDVFVVVTEGAWRDIEMVNGQAFEMVYSSKEAATTYYQNNPNNAVQQWRDLKVIYDPNNVFDELRTIVNKIEKQGKKKLTDKAIRHFRFDVDDRIRVIEYLKEQDFATANYFLSVLGDQAMSLYFDLRQIWTPPPKQRISYLREHDKKVAQLAEELFSERLIAERIAAAKSLIDAIFEN